MKKKVIFLFAFLFWVLAVCTLLALRIEALMTPQVALVDEYANMSALPEDCLFTDETGPHLFTVVEGSGWNSGTRAREVQPEDYLLDGGKIALYTYGAPVQYATKQPRDGYPVCVLKFSQKANDHWVVCSDETLNTPENMREIAVEQTFKDAALLAVQGMPSPFMPNRAKSTLAEKWDSPPKGLTVYSLNDAESFLNALPLLAVLLVSLLVPLILWAYSCRLAKSPRKNKKVLLVNGGIAAACFAALPLLLNAIKLPSSLLPQDNIFDFGHYSHEFSQIFTALQSFAAEGNQTAATALSQAQTALWASLAIMLSGAALGVVMGFQNFRLKQKHRQSPH